MRVSNLEKQFVLEYGEQKIPFTVRAGNIEVVDAVTPPPIANLAEAFRAAVEENAVASLPLRELVKPDDEITIVISDLTRAWMHQERICPLLLRYLHDTVGIPCEKIVFLVALGTHRMETEAELRRLVSDEVFDSVRVVDHDIDGPLADLGVTTFGTHGDWCSVLPCGVCAFPRRLWQGGGIMAFFEPTTDGPRENARGPLYGMW